MDKYPMKVREGVRRIIRQMDDRVGAFAKDPQVDFTRHRKLPFRTLIWFLLCMQGQSLDKELLNAFRLDPDLPSVSALVQGRAKLHENTMPFLFSEVVRAFSCNAKKKGYRLIACDGSDLHYPSNPAETEDVFVTKENARPYNLMHLNALYDVTNQRFLDAVIQSGRHEDEVGAAVQLIDRFPFDENAIFTLDRGYECYNVMAHIIERGMKFLIRVKNPDSVGILRRLQLPVDTAFDLSFSYSLTRKKTNFVKENPHLFRILKKDLRFDFCDLHHTLFYPISFRAVSIRLPSGAYEYLITNLDPDLFPPDKIKDLYHRRWDIETAFRALKYVLSLNAFHSKKAEFIRQEVFARLILYNLCCLIATHAALSRRTRSYVYKVNFSTSVAICRHFFLSSDSSPPDVVKLIRQHLVPIRPGRSDPRKVCSHPAIHFFCRIA